MTTDWYLEEVLFHSHIEDTLHEHICDEYVAARSLHLGGMQFGDAIARPLTAANNLRVCGACT